MQNRSNRQPDASGESHLSTSPDHPASTLSHRGSLGKRRSLGEPTPLAILVRRRLEELELKQSDFCRLTGFDQGLLSKIRNSVITSLSLESTLRLALGLSLAPRVIFDVTDRTDMQELVIKAYAADFFPELSERDGLEIPAPVLEITGLALSAHAMGRSLAPAHALLSYLIGARSAATDNQPPTGRPTEAYSL